MKPLKATKRAQVVALHEAGVPRGAIALQLKVSLRTIHRTIQKYRETGSFETRKSPGRTPMLGNSSGDVQTLQRLITPTETDSQCRFVSLQELTRRFHGTTNLSISKYTLRRYFTSRLGLRNHWAARKPALTEEHRKARLEFAQKYINTTQEAWCNVIWSDETSVQLNGQHRKRVWRRKGERFNRHCIMGSKKGGISIMYWGCFYGNQKGPLAIIEKINPTAKGICAWSYIIHLDKYMLPIYRSLPLGDAIFQQDNAPIHSAAVTTQWFFENRITVLNWPAQSPDLNPIEHLWYKLKKAIYKQQPRTKVQLQNVAQQEWDRISPEYLMKLIESMPRRLQAVIDANGWQTRY